MIVSVIIRTKNEEKWINQCIQSIYWQDWRKKEVIIVDNESTDNTVEIVKGYECKLISISNNNFSYGRALNLGIQEAKGELIAILSGHCIPVNDKWLRNLVVEFSDPKVAGVYGRQEPLPDSHPFDKRDLWTTFGLDRKVQKRDFFFYNANSMIRKSIWMEIPFDESLDGVEDRAWAKEVIAKGYYIVYQPNARVYHYHGIHQGRNIERCERVVKVIEFNRLNGG